MIYGKSVKGNKLKAQDPELIGPFHITPTLGWQEFLDVLVDTAEVTKENLCMGGKGLKWRFQGRTAKLLLKDKKGFLAMKAQLTSHKDPDHVFVVVTLCYNFPYIPHFPQYSFLFYPFSIL